MSKRPFVIFGLTFAVLAVLIPFLAFRTNGDPNTGVSKDVPASLQQGKTLFVTNCGTCHTLYAAGTDGNFGPDLDLLLSPLGPATGDNIKSTKQRVLSAIDNGVDSSTPGRMPAGIISGQQAQQVAEFVANVAGQG